MQTELRLERMPVGEIDTAPYNPRRALNPGDPEYEALRDSLEAFGLVEPLVWNRRTGRLVGGHQRLKVLLDQGAELVDVSVVDLPETQEQALDLALNKVQGAWDKHRLAGLLSDLLETPGVDFGATGFDPGEARDIVSDVLERAVSRSEEADLGDLTGPGSHEAITRPGDLLQLGSDPSTAHYLLCGDCTDPDDVSCLMGRHRARLFATDPPYLVGYTSQSGGTFRGGATGECHRASPLSTPTESSASNDLGEPFGGDWDNPTAQSDLYRRFVSVAIEEALLPNAAWYCWHASRHQAMLSQAWREANVLMHCQIVWVKANGVSGRSWYLWRHEPCLMGWRQGHPPRRASRQRHSTVWEVDAPRSGRERPDHPTPKPVELFEISMRQHTRVGDICFEPFAGSGSQFIAAEKLKRRCFGMEISPVYCDRIVRRLITYGGADAVSPEVEARYRLASMQRSAERSIAIHQTENSCAGLPVSDKRGDTNAGGGRCVGEES